LTDTFEEYAMPLFEKLGYPTVFCNSLVVDKDGFITEHVLRLKDQKRKAIEAFQRLNFRCITVGDSFNDISMLKAAEKGILMFPGQKVIDAGYHNEFPVCRSFDQLKLKILEIVNAKTALSPRELVMPVPLDAESTRMWLVLCNVSGTFAPEPWLALHALTGIKELGTTTNKDPDLSKLMQIRMKALKDNGIKLQKVFETCKAIEPYPGAKDFMEWLRPVVPRSFMVTDTFEEYALPIFAKLGHPMVFCNFLGADEEGYMNKHVIRLQGQKAKCVQELQRLNFGVIAIGYSFLDLPMLETADAGILFKPSEEVRAQAPNVPTAENYAQLKERILAIVRDVPPISPRRVAKKRKNSEISAL
jgi:phosphoserine/homoserine phosphotransferase